MITALQKLRIHFSLGCKIKALRAKTNTYIKTPVRGEDPVFVITGRPEDVSSAKREVLAAAEHFTQIRAAKNNPSTTPGSAGCPRPTASSPDADKIATYVKVPYRVVGLVVGPKGATIKRIQQITSTHIVTPSRDKEPCFEVSGKPEDVERAKKEIESYIAMRTGGCHDSDNESEYSSSIISSPSIDSGVFSPPINSIGRKASDTTPVGGNSSKLMQQFSPRSSASPPATTPVFGVESLENYSNSQLPFWAEPATRSPLSSAVFGGSRDGFSRSNSFNSAEGSFSFGTPPLSAPIGHASTKMFDFNSLRDTVKHDPPSPTYSCSSNSSDGAVVNSPKLPVKSIRLCYVCKEKDVVAALVPCGHNLFCSGCAQMSVLVTGSCPVCTSQVTSMLRLYH